MPEQESKPQTSCNHAKGSGLLNLAEADTEKKAPDPTPIPDKRVRKELDKETQETLNNILRNTKPGKKPMEKPNNLKNKEDFNKH